MSLLDSITSIILPSKKVALVCAKCDRDLSRHDPDFCQRAMSRRTFFMGVGGVVASAAIAKALPKPGTGSLFNPKTNIFEAFRHDAAKIFEVAGAPVEQLVVEAAPKIVTAGVRDVFYHFSRGNWVNKDNAAQFGLKGPSAYGEFGGMFEKPEGLKRWESANFGDGYAVNRVGGTGYVCPPTPPNTSALKLDRYAIERKAVYDEDQRLLRESRMMKFALRSRTHRSVDRYARQESLAGPKGKLPA